MNEFVGSSFPLLSLSSVRSIRSIIPPWSRVRRWDVFSFVRVRLLEPRVLLTYHISRVEYISYLRSSYCYVEPNTTITKTTQHKNTQQQQPTILCFMDNML